MDLAGTFGPYLNADSGRLMASTDGGSSWRVVTHLAHPSPGSGFVRYRINLSHFAGQTIRLRFDFDTFDSRDNGHEGWYLDNIRVSRLGREPARLSVEPASMSFSGVAGGSPPPAQDITVSTAGGTGSQSLVWTATVTQGASWLNLLPASGSTPSLVQVSVISAGLDPGPYRGEIRLQALQQPKLITILVVSLELKAAGPLASWSFDEPGQGPAITLADRSSRGHDGATAGSGTAAIAGVEGQARVFDGVSSYVAVPASPDFSRPQLSLRAWVKLEDYPATLGVIASALDPETLQGWLLGVLETGNVVLVARGPLGQGASGELLWLVSRSALTLGDWRSVTATLDRSGGSAVLYLDGRIEASASFTGYNLEAAPLTIGRASWWAGYYLRFAIDEMLLDSGVWSAAQVRADLGLFSPPPPEAPAAPVAEWRFEQPLLKAGGVLRDYSSSGHDGLVHGSDPVAVDGLDAGASLFDGAAGYATVPPHPDFASASFTFSTWIRLDAYPRDWGVVFSNFDGDYRGWFTGVHSDGRVIVSIWGRPSDTSWVFSAGRLELGRWHHLAVNLDDLSGRAALYIDGKADRSFNPPGFTQQTTAPLTFARASWFDGYYLRCAFDETKVFAVALPAHAIRREFERLQAAAAAGGAAVGTP
jgi:hypothetical protein